MDPKATANLHPDIKARLDRVMSTPTTSLLQPTPTNQPAEDLLVQKQDANSLRMPPSSVSPVDPLEHTPPVPAFHPVLPPIEPQPVPVAQPTPVEMQSQKKNTFGPILWIIGGIIFFAGYAFMWIRIFNPSFFGK